MRQCIIISVYKCFNMMMIGDADLESTINLKVEGGVT